MTTAARPTSEASCHWYDKMGNPVYEVPRAKGEGMRPTTLADARKLNLLPSVTTILSILRKPQLESWLVEQAVLAALTTPRNEGEPLDAFVQRVLHEERVQDQESDIAKKRGTEIHDCIEQYFKSTWNEHTEVWPWVAPVAQFLESIGDLAAVEAIVVSRDGYAGRTDLIQDLGDRYQIWDFKTTKRLPKTNKAYDEHVLQCAAYANGWKHDKPITTGNIYISTIVQGDFAVCEHEHDWSKTYTDGFQPLLNHWRWANNYHP